jgi:hypothetical protein
MPEPTGMYPQAPNPFNAADVNPQMAQTPTVNKLQNTSPTNDVVNNMASGAYTPPYMHGGSNG